MDSHLFGIFAQAATPILLGARVEKIQEPAPSLLTMTVYGAGKKRQLFFHYGRRDPFCFLGNDRLASGREPSARIMRIRRYFGQRRIGAVVARADARQLWLLASGQPAAPAKSGEAGGAVWLCLDLVEGPSLRFGDADTIPDAAPFQWPEPGQLETALANWRAWPALTPPLRKTMAALTDPDRAALLEDLRLGGGDVFLYSEKQGERERVTRALAWPLPPALRGDLVETCREDILAALELAGRDLVLTRLYEEREARLAQPGRKRARRIQATLARLEEDSQRLRGMAAREADAQALRASLWRWPADARLEKITLRDDANGQEREVILDRRFSVRANMERLFHEVRRGKRGLAMLEERRGNLLAELESLGSGVGPQARTPAQAGGESGTPGASHRNLPKNIRACFSSDGYTILRGLDARGNQALRRHSAPHDLWTHVEQGPGAHVVIRRPHPGHEIPERTLDEAGALAASKSWLRDSETASVMYAEMRHVRATRGGAPGKVTIDRILMTRLVTVEPAVEERLCGQGSGSQADESQRSRP